MNDQTEIAVHAAAPLAVRGTESEQVMDLFRRAFEGGGSTPEALDRLVALKERVDRRNAELAFSEALADFQRECPAVPRTSTAEIVTKNGGKFGYSYADFEQIVETVRPHLARVGLSFTFDSSVEGKALTCTATLRHRAGHEVTSAFTLPTDTASAMSAQQAVGAALTFAKRQCLVSVLGLSLTDPDPDNEGDPSKITEEQVADLKALAQEVNADMAKFLAYLKVEKLADLPAKKHRAAVAALEAKRRAS